MQIQYGMMIVQVAISILVYAIRVKLEINNTYLLKKYNIKLQNILHGIFYKQKHIFF